MTFRLLAAAAFLVWALPAGAQQAVTLEFSDGEVTLVARNAPVRAILAEWARLGGSTVVNGDRVAGPPVTLELTGVSERQAIDIVLRDVAGYMLAPRRAGTAGASVFDRIVILPTSTAPPNVPAPSAVARPFLQRPPVIMRPPVPEVENEPVPEDVPDTDAPIMVPGGELRVPGQTPGGPGQSGVQILSSDEEPDSAPAPAPGSAPPSSSNPFGLPYGSSTTPGTIAPAPPPQPERPGPNPVQ